MTSEPVRNRHDDILIRFADRAFDYLDQLLSTPVHLPYTPPGGHIQGLYVSMHGDLCAEGDAAVVELLRRHLEAGGAPAPEVLAVVQMAGRYGARVFVAPPGSALSIQFLGKPADRAMAMLQASGMQRVVGSDGQTGVWMWSEDPAGGNLLGAGR